MSEQEPECQSSGGQAPHEVTGSREAAVPHKPFIVGVVLLDYDPRPTMQRSSTDEDTDPPPGLSTSGSSASATPSSSDPEPSPDAGPFPGAGNSQNLHHLTHGDSLAKQVFESRDIEGDMCDAEPLSEIREYPKIGFFPSSWPQQSSSSDSDVLEATQV